MSNAGKVRARSVGSRMTTVVSSLAHLWKRWFCMLIACLLHLSAAGAETPKSTTLPLNSIDVLALDNFPPLLFRDASGELQGVVKDYWLLWEARTGIKVHLVAADWATIYKEMLAGHADVLDMARATEERKKFLDFSEPNTQLNMMLYFHESITGIVDANTSRGFLVGVIEAGGCEEKLRAAGASYFKRYLTFDELVTAASRDEVRVFCAYEPQANYFLNRLGKAKEFRHSPALYTADGRWAVRKGDASLYQLVADGFATISPAERTQIQKKWDGIDVVSPDSPLYIRYAGYSLLALLGIGLLLLLWNELLRRQVRAKTAVLTQTLN